MTKKELKELHAANDRANQRWVDDGRRLTRYICPHCRETVEVRRPRKADVGSKGFWDSLTMCVHCGELSFVKTYPTGDCVAKLPETAEGGAT